MDANAAALLLILFAVVWWIVPIPRDRFAFVEDDTPHNIWAMHLWLARFSFIFGILILYLR